jgi:predicted enzyme related to lactoylglutathione lyase
VLHTFYAQLFGWRLQVLKAIDYALIELGRGILPGRVGQADETQPAGITTYSSVDEVKATIARAEQLGAKVARSVWEVSGLGRWRSSSTRTATTSASGGTDHVVGSQPAGVATGPCGSG